MKRLIVFLIQKYCPFNIKYFQIFIGVILTVLLVAVLVLGWMSSKKIREVVTEDFNQQQLVLSKHTASQIENSLNKLKREMSLLSLSPSIQYTEPIFMNKRMEIALSSIKDDGGLEIRFIEDKNLTTYIIDNEGSRTIHPDMEDIASLKWAQKAENKGDLYITPVTPMIYSSNYMKLIMRMVIPVWQVSVDETHPKPQNRFSGALILVVDVTQLIEKITRGICSGKTGYAWVIDENGIFLHHPEAEFIGKNAFEVRKEKKPSISFARINEIQKERMLKGMEGTSWYISGWHMGKEELMEKLIAYAPINLGSSRIWSVAVVAPISEVEGAIHSIHIRQFSLQAIVILVIMLGAMIITVMMLNWSTFMEREVDIKTKELKKSEQSYRSLVENAEDIIFRMDKDGMFLSINKYGADFFGKSPKEIIGHTVAEILPWPNSEVLSMMVKEVFDTKQGRQITHPIKIKDNEYWFNTNLRRLWDEEGNIYAVLGISRDITNRKKMEEQSYYTEKLASLGTLSAGVAHEINNPLGIILGFADLLLEKTPQGSETYDILKTIEKHGLNAKRVVESLLSFSRYAEQKEEYVDINKNIESVLSVISNTLLLNRISATHNLKPDLPSVRANAGELQQVFFNIINNSISAMKSGGALTITTQTADSAVEIRISDTGHGIQKEYRSRVFDPLFTTKKVGEGTGLGLSVSYGIITKYNGTITFETRTEEESNETGTTFIITLPKANKSNKQTGDITDKTEDS